MITVPDEDLYAVITVNLCCPLQTDRLAFVDENNLPGIGAWLKRNKIATPLGYKQRSGYSWLIMPAMRPQMWPSAS